MFMMLKIEKVSEKQVCNLLAIDVCWNFQLCKAVNHSLISISVFGPCYMLADPMMQNLECGWGTYWFKQLWLVICRGLPSRWLLACAEGMPGSTTFRRTLKVQKCTMAGDSPALHGERAVAVSLIFSYNLNKLHIPDIEWSLSIPEVRSNML